MGGTAARQRANTGKLSRERMDIERLVHWALGEQGLGWAANRDAGLGWADYGTMIDSSGIGAPSISLMTDDDAMVVKLAIDALPGEAQALVVQFGRIGLRPEWCPEGVGDWVQKRDKRGRKRWIYDSANHRGGRQPMLEFIGTTQASVDWHRAAYGLWWQALADLVGPLNNRMETHYATGPEAEQAPWTRPVREADFDVASRHRAERRREVDEVPVIATREGLVREQASDWSNGGTIPPGRGAATVEYRPAERRRGGDEEAA